MDFAVVILPKTKVWQAMDPFDVHKPESNTVKLPIGQADVFSEFDSATPLNDFFISFFRKMTEINKIKSYF